MRSRPPPGPRSSRRAAAFSSWTPGKLVSPREGHQVLRAFVNAFKIPDLRKKILFTLFIIAVFRFGSHLPAPDIDFNKITQWTRYMTVTLALLQSTGLVFLFNNQFQVVKVFDAQHVAVIVLTLTAGIACIMWLGELITQRGIGNGMSILIFTSVISRLPSEGLQILHVAGQAKFYFFLLLGVGIIFAVVFMEQGQRRIPVQYAKRIVGRKQTSGGSTYIPLKVNQAGVIPIIFASSVLYFPTLIASTIHNQGLTTFINNHVTNQRSVTYMLLYALLIIFFAYF